MVPHRAVLQLISLISLSSSNPEDTRDALCRELEVKFPCTLPDYLANDVFKWLTADVEALLRTTDAKLLFDYQPLFIAAKQLCVDRYLCITSNGPALNLPSVIVKWRENKSLRICIEAMLLAEVGHEQIAEDVHHMFGISVVADDIAQYESLFVDKFYVKNWLMYAFCIGDEEAKFKRSLMGEPKDYVRWRLGVPVALDSERVVNRMVSDAYFTLRLLKGKIEDPTILLTKDQMTRIKMEQDVIFKGLDRRVKLAELANAAGASSSGVTDAAEAIKQIALEFLDHKHPIKSDVMPDTVGGLNG